MQIGIIRETKIPQDSRVCLPPVHCKAILDAYPSVTILVQPSDIRCYSDKEYQELGIQVQEDISACDILMGVKEVKIDALIANKTYFFFSHTIKKQVHNKKLLQAVLSKNIHLVDYETLTDSEGKRVIAFGKWAGIVGAHNGIRTWGKRMNRFDLKAMHACFDFAEAMSYYPSLDLQGLKIVLTGTGRVSSGSAQVLDAMNIQKLDAKDFLEYEGNDAVYCMLETHELFAKKSDKGFDAGFYQDPSAYESIFYPYLCKANLLINGIYWDSRCPALFSLEDINQT
jgi:saccharopine dehydrogenase (NAD+, L-lysine-forming)